MPLPGTLKFVTVRYPVKGVAVGTFCDGTHHIEIRGQVLADRGPMKHTFQRRSPCPGQHKNKGRLTAPLPDFQAAIEVAYRPVVIYADGPMLKATQQTLQTAFNHRLLLDELLGGRHCAGAYLFEPKGEGKDDYFAVADALGWTVMITPEGDVDADLISGLRYVRGDDTIVLIGTDGHFYDALKEAKARGARLEVACLTGQGDNPQLATSVERITGVIHDLRRLLPGIAHPENTLRVFHREI